MVYVDDMYAPFRAPGYFEMKMCHMIADSTHELVAMAKVAGINKVHIQDQGTHDEHFDVSMTARRKVVAAGAVEITMGELGVMLQDRRDGVQYLRERRTTEGEVEARGLSSLSKKIVEERGMPGVGVAIWRRGEDRDDMWRGSVGEFLGRPDRQWGTWLIDGGWGGPPGPREVDWIEGEWIDQGYLGEERRRR